MYANAFDLQRYPYKEQKAYKKQEINLKSVLKQ